MRRLSLRGSIAAWLVIGLAVWLEHTLPHVTTPHTEFFWGWLVSALGAIFGFVASQAVTFAVMVAHVAVQLALAIGHAMVLVGQVFASVYGLLGKFWSHVLRPTFSFLVRQFDRFVGWLNRTLKPIIETIERIRKHVQRIYDKYVKPILDVIEVTRRVFQLLAALHVPFAREIDRKLAELEDRLLAPIRFVMAKLNEALDWINRIVTLDGLLQRITLIRSLIAHAGESWAVLVGKQLEDVDPARTDAMRARDYPAATPEQIAKPLAEYFATGTGEYAETIRELARIAASPSP